jgi:V8-like Glu-specific endopeptidase
MALAQSNQPKAGQRSTTQTEMATAQAFWTADKMANAKAMPLTQVDPFNIKQDMMSAPAPAGQPGFIPAARPTISPSNQGPVSTNEGGGAADTLQTLTQNENVEVQPDGFSYVFPYNTYRPAVLNGYPYSAIGKLFFFIPAGASEPSGEYVCSASVDLNNHTLVTARHCAFDYSTGKWFSNWQFCPAYNSGPNSVYHNCWTVRRAATWVSGASSFDYDIALLQLNDAAGFGCAGSSRTAPIGNYTGWLGAAWNTNFGQTQWEIFGYPQAAPFDGNHQYETDAATGTTNPFGFNNVVEVGSDQTGGTSGGPWILGLDPYFQPDPAPSNNIFSSSGNWVNSVNSFKFTFPNQPLAINGPEFMTYNFLNLVNYYNTLSCP